ncbi:hypothetical protein AB0Y04_04905 [Loigolactobacillus coryniformis]|uniref:hypothetical protein n=1 Tax=Loigolactobacillus TaxID=2767889 RepID=UPI000F748CD0|nr:hypothetical protein [Loigolactobacillus zhaoyuanensis]
MKNGDRKFSGQLSADFEHSEVSRTEAAKKLYVSKSQITKYTQGTVSIPKVMKKAITGLMGSIKLSYSAARADYGVISFLKNPRQRDDVLSANTTAVREERERQALEDEFMNAITLEPKFRTSKQQEIIDSYLRNFIEEIGAEHTKLIALAAYLNVDVQVIVDEFNNKLGG